jgi:hypothetical protein
MAEGYRQPRAARDPLKAHIADLVFDAVSGISAISLGDHISWVQTHRYEDDDILLSICRKTGSAPVKYYLVKITERRT